MNVREGELDQVVRQRLHLVLYAETVAVHLLVLLGLLEVQRVETVGDRVVLVQGLLAGHHREGLLGANLYYQQLVLLLL